MILVDIGYTSSIGHGSKRQGNLHPDTQWEGWWHLNPFSSLLPHAAGKTQADPCSLTTSVYHRYGSGSQVSGHHHRHKVLAVTPSTDDAETEIQEFKNYLEHQLEECVAVLIGLYKKHGAVSHVTMGFLFIWCLYLTRTWLVWVWFARNKKEYFSLLNLGNYIKFWLRWRTWFILKNWFYFFPILW